MSGAIISSTSVHWNTPEWLVKAVKDVLGKTIDLDPCSNATSIVKAATEILPPQDGLAVEWASYYTVYVNPPYGRGIAKWIEKAALTSWDHTSIIMVIPAAVGTKHWHNWVFPYASRICFLKGRVEFTLDGKPKAGAAHDTAVVLFTSDKWTTMQFEDVFEKLGWVVDASH